MVLRYTFRVFRLFFSTYLQEIVRKIGNNQKAHMHFHIMLSFQNCNYKLRNFFLSHSRSDFYLVKDRKPALRYIGLSRVYIHRDVLFLYIWIASSNLLRLFSRSISNIAACSHWNSWCLFL